MLLPMPMLMPIMEDITAMVVMALAMAAMVVMALVIMADGTVKDLLMLSPLPMLMPSPLPMLMLMPMLTHITEDTTDGEVTDSEVTEDMEDTMALVITADGMAKDRPMPSPKLMPITEVTTDMEVMEVAEVTEDIMVDIVDTT